MSINYFENDADDEVVTSTHVLPEDGAEGSTRPRTLAEFTGQEKAKGNLRVFIEAAKLRGESLDHVLLHGPPGLGKTTLAGVIASEMGVNMRITSGPTIEKAGDLVALLTNLQENDILFVDEIHRLNRAVEEILYPAMEDNAIDIIIGKGPSANSIRLDLKHHVRIPYMRFYRIRHFGKILEERGEDALICERYRIGIIDQIVICGAVIRVDHDLHRVPDIVH